MREGVVVAWLALLMLPLVALAQGGDHLIPGPGSTLTENKCRICHELQHIKRQPLSAGEWSDNLKNMKERGAPISDAEFEVIHRYLSTYYNREKPAPAPSADTLAAGGDPVERLLGAHACSGCHAKEQRVVGPSFREVAAKYAADPSSADHLMRKIREGGRGVWGQVPMPPNPGIPDAELKAIVGWVLEQKPK
ncbi:MAG TPA: c-type cytochrome [Burkholderiales bacterium]